MTIDQTPHTETALEDTPAVPLPPAGIPLQEKQLSGVQAARREALRLAIDLCRHRQQLTSEAVIQTADKFSEFIRFGAVPKDGETK